MMKRAISKRAISAILVVLIVLGAFCVYYRFRQRNFLKHSATKYQQPPDYLGSIDFGRVYTLFGSKKSGKQPLGVSASQGKIYLTYADSDKVDILSYTGKLLSSFSVSRPNMPAEPISAGADDSDKIYVSDSRNHELKMFDSKGKFLDSYGWTPNRKRKLSPSEFCLNQGMLYLTDTGMSSVLVISTAEKKPFREAGELVLIIPLPPDMAGPPPGSGTLPSAPVNVNPASKLKWPCGVAVTGDGRVLVSDSELGLVKVYTCVGRYAYDFEQGRKGNYLSEPQGIALDDLSNSKLKNQEELRVHVVDKRRKKVFVFTDKGKFLFTYGGSGEGKLSSPTDIAIDSEKNLIFIADGGNKRVAIFGY